ncbi:MAG TPA: acyl-CoA synthetase, partial [Desulfobulbaceae bacterium]|nr:acyl-CoA synthetase [Desulfobulbaceae bacterium]
VSDIKAPVEMALITTPAATIPGILEDCGKKGVAGAVIIAGGFGELGAEGKKLEKEMVAAAQRNHIRLIGPNTSGMINLKKHLNVVGLRDVPTGNIALLSQSGNMALTMITEAMIKTRMGFSYYVGVGNEADIRFHEYLKFFTDDPDTRAILMYVEGMRNGRAFLQQAYQTTRVKPVILLKSGRSATGRKSAGSHTGALAGMSEVAKTAFQRAGIVVIENSDELLPAAESLANLPPIKNNNVVILADGGGHATIAADELTDLKINLLELSEKTQEKLRKILPAAASVRNPIDVAGGGDSNPGIFAECAEIILQDHEVGGLLMVGLFGGYSIRFAESLRFVEEDAAHRLGKLVKKTEKPIVMHSLYNFAKPHALELLRYYKIPVQDSLEIACKCIGTLAEYGGYLRGYKAKAKFTFTKGEKSRARGREIFAQARKEGRNSLLENEAKELLSLHGQVACVDCLATSAEQAVEQAAGIDGAVVMKIVSPDILHKSDAGGVKLNLETPEEVRQAYKKIMSNAKKFKFDAKIKGVLVSPMASVGQEIIIGTKIDDQFGPIIMFGIGGVMVEVLKDVAFRVLPISARSARRMIDEIKSAVLLNGFRGRPPVDKKAIQHLLLAVSEIIGSYPEIQEMDLNPVIAYEQGLNVVDARIILTPENKSRW